MTRVRVEVDEHWPAFGVYPADHSIGLLAEVPETQLAYWDMVVREWERVQRQMATAHCTAYGHRAGPASPYCLSCNPVVEEVPND